MPGAFKRLGDAELEIMMILWHAEAQLTATQIQEALRGRRDAAFHTYDGAFSS